MTYSLILLLLSIGTRGAHPAAVPDFSGRWRLVEQTTAAFQGRSAIGNHEEPVVITVEGSRLTVTVQTRDRAPVYEYDLSGAELVQSGPSGEALAAVSRWDGLSLVTKGRRVFMTSEGPTVFSFQETRRLSKDGQRMTVETRISMSGRDLHRTSVYLRASSTGEPSSSLHRPKPRDTGRPPPEARSVP